MSSKVIEITNINDYDAFKRTHRRGIVFYGAEWCEACKEIMPLYTRIANKYYKRIAMAHVDIEVCKLDFSRVPVFVSLRRGKELDNMVGANKEALKQFIKEAIEFESRPQPRVDKSRTDSKGNIPQSSHSHGPSTADELRSQIPYQAQDKPSNRQMLSQDKPSVRQGPRPSYPQMQDKPIIRAHNHNEMQDKPIIRAHNHNEMQDKPIIRAHNHNEMQDKPIIRAHNHNEMRDKPIIRAHNRNGMQDKANGRPRMYSQEQKRIIDNTSQTHRPEIKSVIPKAINEDYVEENHRIKSRMMVDDIEDLSDSDEIGASANKQNTKLKNLLMNDLDDNDVEEQIPMKTVNINDMVKTVV